MTVHKGRNHQGIFGTPEEPIFNSPGYHGFPQILQEQLFNMASQNAADIQRASSKQGLFRQGVAASFLFNVCERLHLSSQVKFVAIELFDRFMQKHIEELYRHVYTNPSRPTQKPRDWHGILERVNKQLYLRIVSCCQIASKLTSHHKVVLVSRAKRFLLELGHNYTPSSILQSELRVLKTLDFRVAFLSPLDFVETILQVLAYNMMSLDLPVSLYQSVSVKLLTVLHLRSDNVFMNLLHANSRLSMSGHFRHGLSEAQADKMLMASGVIAAAAYISDQEHTDLVIGQLERITLVPREDMEDFVSTLVREVRSSDP